MTMFELDADGTRAHKLGTGEWHAVGLSEEYKAWAAKGNTPLVADPIREPDPAAERLEKIDALHEKAVAIESKLSDQDRELWRAQTPVFRALVSFLGISEDQIADVVEIARKLERS